MTFKALRKMLGLCDNIKYLLHINIRDHIEGMTIGSFTNYQLSGIFPHQ